MAVAGQDADTVSALDTCGKNRTRNQQASLKKVIVRQRSILPWNNHSRLVTKPLRLLTDQRCQSLLPERLVGRTINDGQFFGFATWSHLCGR